MSASALSSSAESSGFEFDQDTALEELSPGLLRGEISSRWSIGGGVPNGGYIFAMAARALAVRMDKPDPVSVSGLFLRGGQPGPVDITTQGLKSGRRLEFGSAVMTQDGSALLSVQAVFGELPEQGAPSAADLADPVLGVRFEAGVAPELPPPEECIDPMLNRRDGPRSEGVGGRLEYRSPTDLGWVTGRPSGVLEHSWWLRLADGREPDVFSLLHAVDATPPAIAELGVWSTTVELTAHIRARPAPGWLRARVETRHVSAGFHEEDVELWDSAGVLVAQSRQLALVRSTQGRSMAQTRPS